MYNNEMSLKLLNVVVGQVSGEDLQRIQKVVDEDKYKMCCELGYDLCGTYAPFCAYCDKSLYTPCAVAYVKMLQSESAQCADLAECEPKRIRIAMLRRKKTNV